MMSMPNSSGARTERPDRESVFENLFTDPVYLRYKNSLYNFLVRRFVIRRHARTLGPTRILELGCGTSPMLTPRHDIIQTDLSWRGLRSLVDRARNNNRYQPVGCDATELPFQDGVFGSVICSEVIEHIKEDGLVLREISRVLQPGGEVYLTCPVHAKYFSFDDQYVGHQRRYEIEELEHRLQDHGLEILEIQKLLGPLEKRIMNRVTQFFARRGGRSSVFSQIGLLLWPLYAAVNVLLAAYVYLEAQYVPLEKVMSVCFRCRKRK